MAKQATKTHGAVIVTRVSSGEQDKHSSSPETQLENCRAKAESLTLPIVAEYYDAALSGAYLLSRPGMQAALADIREGRADTLICPNISRYSRDEEHQHAIKKAVKAAGGRLVFCDMHFEDTPEGDLNFTIQGGFAAYERKVIHKRLNDGKRKRAREGQQPQRSRSPYGYHVVTRADVIRGEHPADMLGRYVVVEETAAVARRLFEAYAGGAASLPGLARTLNREGVATPGKAVAWHEGTIRVILKNPVYKGQPASGRQKTITDEGRLGQPNVLNGRPLKTMTIRREVPEGEWIPLAAPALVSEETWDAVQARFGAMNARYGGNPKQTRMLSGLAACPHCLGPAITRYQTANGRPYRYFVCSASRKGRWRGEAACRPDVYPISLIDDSALLALKEAYSCPQSIDEAMTLYRRGDRPAAPSAGAIDRELAGITATLAQLGREEAAVVQAQIAGIKSGASPHAYAAVFADLAARRKDLEDRRGELTRQKAAAKGGAARGEARDREAVRRALEDAWRVLTSDAVPGATKRRIIGQVVQKVICQKDGARVVFVPGLFGEGDEDGAEGDGSESDGGIRRTCQTTCIGIRTQR